MCEVDCILSKVYEKCGCIGFEFRDMTGKLQLQVPFIATIK